MAGLAAALLPRGARADEQVPLGRQAELIAKVAPYDRAFAERAGDAARVLVVHRGGDDESTHAARELQSALGSVGNVGGLAVSVSLAPYRDAPAVAQAVRDQRIAILYLAPKLLDECGAIAAALAGGSVLSVAGDAAYVSRRIVLGFELVSGKPKLVVHLDQAKQQGVSFRAEALKLMRVIE